MLNKNTLLKFLFILTIFLPLYSSAKKIPVFTERKNLDNLSVDSSISVTNDLIGIGAYPTDTSWRDGYCFKSSIGRVFIGLKSHFISCPSDSFNLGIRLRLKFMNHLNQVDSIDTTLSVSYSALAGITYNEKAIYTNENSFYVTATILEISDTSLRSYAYIETQVEQERYFCGFLPSVHIPEIVAINYISSSDEIEVVIDSTIISKAEFYELEWTFEDAYSNTSLASMQAKSTVWYDFRRNSNRIQITNHRYRLSNVFEKGYVVFRVRAISYMSTDQIQYESEWSIGGNGNLNSVSSDNIIAIDNSAVNEHEDSINWAYSASYAEEGRKKEVINYFDGILKERQSVTKNYTDSTAIVSEKIYDHQGRLAVQTLPVPAFDKAIKYFHLFNRDDSSFAYSYNDFELTEGCTSITQPMSNDHGSSKYYSENNNLLDLDENNFKKQMALYIPDANSFPFTQTEYMPDNTNRVRRQSGVGSDHKINSGHETKYYYAVPEQIELDRLFGTEVGYAKHYKKNMVIDPNNQASVSYLDSKGRVIATALAGASPENLIPLESNISIDDNESLINSAEDTLMNEGEIIISKKIMVTDNNLVYRFAYSLSPEKYMPSCNTTGVCYDCVYDLKVKLTDECGNILIDIDKIIGYGGEVTDTLCGEGSFTYSFGEDEEIETNEGYIEVTLNRGTYQLSKSLVVNNDAYEFYLNDYLENRKCKSFDDFLNDAFKSIDTNSCFIDCQSCLDSLGAEGSYIAKQAGFMIADGKTLTLSDTSSFIIEYEKLLKNCNLLCDTNTNTCDHYLEILKSDFEPGGQYARYIYNESNGRFVADLSETNGSFNFLDTTSGSSFDYTYKTHTWFISHGDTIDGVYKPFSQMSVDLFVKHWRDTFSAIIVSMHPEYCKYQSCITNSEFDQFHLDFMETETYEQALAKGYLNPLDSLIDPYFQSGNAGNSILSATLTRLNNYKTLSFSGGEYNITIWDIAVSSLFCNETNLSDSDFYECIQNNRDSILSCNTFKDFSWVVFRGLYSSLRQHLIDSLRQQTSCNDAEINDEINPSSATYYTLRLPENNLGEGLDVANQTSREDFVEELKDQMVVECSSRCSSYAEIWREELAGCNITTTQMDVIIDSLIQVCSFGCDDVNPFGSSTVAPLYADFTSIELKSFNDVLTSGLGSSIFVPGVCDDVLIKMPKPYGHPYMAYNSPLADTCACNQFLYNFPVPSNPKCNDTVLTPNKNCPCSEQTSLVNDDAKKLLGFQKENDVQYKCKTCTDCRGLRTSLDDFEDIYASYYDSSDIVFKPIITNYLNIQLGFNLTYNEYLEFMASCSDTIYDDFNDSLVIGQFKTSVTPNFIGDEEIVQSMSLIDTCGCDKILKAYQDFSADSSNTYSGFKAYYQNNYFCGGEIENSFVWGTLNICAAGVLGGYPVNHENELEEYLLSNLPSNWQPGQWQQNTYGSLKRIDAFYELRTAFGIFIPAELNSCDPIECCKKLCNKPFNEIGLEYTDPCKDKLKRIAYANANLLYQNYLDSVSLDFRRTYVAKCMSSGANEEFSMVYGDRQYHYTLYYYDQAGNLVKTVPPKGVVQNSNSTFISNVRSYRSGSNPHTQALPDHNLNTVYKYNTLNALTWQQTPDGGISNFYYDGVGRLVASQNAKQEPSDKYSYTIFDGLSRIIEVGQITPVESITASMAKDTSQLNTWLSTSSKEQITNTWYDNANYNVVDTLLFNQKNLRNRVVYSTYKEFNGSEYNHAVHYNYDIAGNVKSLLREIPSLAFIGQDYKITNYDYDLVSGKVNNVMYQINEPDQYIHEYNYDLDNRISKVSSGHNSELLDKDAEYYYYMHGPLARTELGKTLVQGVDYAYTIQGWLKGVNTSSGSKYRDIGRDGDANDVGFNMNQYFAQDVYGFTLNYFQGDYSCIGGLSTENSFEGSTVSASLNGSGPDLFNGNIRMMAVSIKQFGNLPMAYAYQYDQLNRIVEMNAFNNFDSSDNIWASTGASMQAYFNNFTYDANGNILSQKRNGNSTTTSLDNLTYNYYSNTNRLKYVHDSISSGNYSDDIDNQTDTLNYLYDPIGNLIHDAAEEIDTIFWNVYGKITRIKRFSSSTKPDLQFEYSPDGHRVLKVVIPKSTGAYRTYTYYSRDAQGNILATYTRNFSKIIDYDSIPYQGINDTLVNYYGDDAFGNFTSGNYPNNSSLSDALLSNVLTTSDVETILDNFDLHDYIFTDAENNLLTILSEFEPSGLINHFANWIKNEGNYGMFLNNLCAHNHDIILYTLQNGPLTDFFYSFYFHYPTEFENMFTAVSGQGYIDYGTSLDWLVNNGDMNDVNNWMLSNMDCYAKSSILLGVTDFYLVLKDWLLSLSDYSSPILYGLNDNSALWNYLVGYNLTELRSAIYSSFDTDLILTWYESNQQNQFIQYAAKEVPQYVSQWQTSNATHSMEDYFNFIKSFYGQTIYDNILQLYNNATRTYLDSFNLAEWHIYGNSRIGIYKISRNLVAVKFTANEAGGTFSETLYGSAFFAQYEYNLYHLQRGNKHYELTNHLGNVLTVVSDKRILVCNSDTVSNSNASIVSASDYSPFGAPLSERTYSSEAYRFAFNGQEKDDETYGEGNAYDFGARICDVRLGGRFFSIDPKWKNYSSMTPYCFAANSPILCIDENGEGPIIGFIVGVVVDYGFQVAVNMANGHSFKAALFHNIDRSSILISGLSGAATSGLSVFATTIKGASLLSKVRVGTVHFGELGVVAIIDGASGAASKMTNNIEDGNPVMEDALESGLLNATTGMLGDGLANKIGDAIDTKELEKLNGMYQDRNARVGSNSSQEAAERSSKDLSSANTRNEVVETVNGESAQNLGNLTPKIDGGVDSSRRSDLSLKKMVQDRTYVAPKR